MDTPRAVTSGEGVELSRMTFSENDAEYGAAVYVNKDANVTFDNVTFIENTAAKGAAVYVSNGGRIHQIKDSTFAANGQSSK